MSPFLLLRITRICTNNLCYQLHYYYHRLLRRTLILSVLCSAIAAGALKSVQFVQNKKSVIEYFKIGKFVTVHGLTGELLLKHSFGKKTSLKGLQAIFIEEKKDSFIPWFIESAKSKNEEETYIKLEGIDTREAAAKLLQKEIWFLGSLQMQVLPWSKHRGFFTEKMRQSLRVPL